MQCVAAYINRKTRQSHSWTCSSHSTVNLPQFPLHHTLPFSVCHAHIMIHKHPHNWASPLYPGFRMYFTNRKWNVIYSETYRHTFIQHIQRITSLRQECLSPQPASNIEGITSFRWPHCTNPPAAFPQASSEERRKCKLEMLIAHTAPTVAEIMPSCCSHWQSSRQHLYSPVGGHIILPKPVSVKQRRNHWFLGSVCCKPPSCATQQMVQVWGWHAHTPETRKMEFCRSSLYHQHISSSSSLLCTQTHLWLYVKHHSPHSNSVI